MAAGPGNHLPTVAVHKCSLAVSCLESGEGNLSTTKWVDLNDLSSSVLNCKHINMLHVHSQHSWPTERWADLSHPSHTLLLFTGGREITIVDFADYNFMVEARLLHRGTGLWWDECRVWLKRYRISQMRCRILEVRYRISGERCRILEERCRIWDPAGSGPKKTTEQ